VAADGITYEKEVITDWLFRHVCCRCAVLLLHCTMLSSITTVACLLVVAAVRAAVSS
jgi:hypothetical protein